MAANSFIVVFSDMCGRKTLTRDMKSIIEDLSIDVWEEPDTYSPSYNIAPTHSSPILVQDRSRKIRNMKWGLIPSWAKDDSFAAKTINARSETLTEKPAYRSLVHKNRCIVIADGYYEWSGASKDKTPHYIYAKDSSLLLMAGLWDTWEKGEDKILSFTIITAQAEGEMADIHPRTPVILKSGMADSWINVDSVRYADVASFLTAPKVPLSHHTVSRKMNRVGYNMPDCILPFENPTQTALF